LNSIANCDRSLFEGGLERFAALCEFRADGASNLHVIGGGVGDVGYPIRFLLRLDSTSYIEEIPLHRSLLPCVPDAAR